MITQLTGEPDYTGSLVECDQPMTYGYKEVFGDEAVMVEGWIFFSGEGQSMTKCVNGQSVVDVE